ncbi:MAG: tripartite tricarboxylate transporter substrate binding protein [Burkholderiales bacterium]|nr:MAG: tripartite tricarboxylate transporter substrate binding protein [Betaproteobacteria bacterium]TAG24055.1 MAG: tripartite tricarboxylate transporter substrate binding protein [Burkholderiales bacterium]TAG71385.1 MAG: tripartite tricarboxylate transporter substrate binding protein [Burkholderiales bacterium]
MPRLSALRRRSIIVALAASFFSLGALQSHAQAWPNKPIKIIMGFPAGGPLDQHARLWADKLGTALGQTVVIDYKPGAAGAIGADTVAKSPADGYTLLIANTGTMVINPALYKKLAYDTLKDFVPVARTAQQPLAIVVNPAVEAKTIAELLAMARKNPKKINYGSAGAGGISHLVPEMLEKATGVEFTHVPYKGSAPAFNDLIGGQVQFMAESVPQAATYAKSGKLRALAVTSRARNVALPDVPTMIESGVKDFEVVGFYGLLAPAATPKDVVAKISDAMKKILEEPAMRDRMIASGADPAFLGSDAFGAFLKAEMPKWAKAVKDSGAQLD